jgi:polysaccharide biosynthesis transport protein
MDSSTKTKSNPAMTEGLHLQDLLQVLKLRRQFLYFFTIMAVVGTIFKTIFYIPTYVGQTTLNIQKVEQSPLQLALANLGTTSFDSTDRLKKYLDYLQNHEFFLAVAETLKFQEGYQKLNLTPPGEMSLTKKKFWKHFFATHFGRKEQPTEKPEPVLVPVEELATILRHMTQAQIVGNDTVKIFVTSLDSFTSMVLANTASQVFVAKTSERDYNEVTQVKQFIQSQLESTTDRLKSREASLVEFKRKHNIISINAEHTSFSSKIGTIEAELENTKLKYEENKKLIEFYQTALNKEEKNIIAHGSGAIKSSKNELVNRLRQQLDSLRQKKVIMQAQGFAETSWEMAGINKEIDRIAKNLKDQFDASGKLPEDEFVGVTADIARVKMKTLQAENKSLEAKIQTIEKSRQELIKSMKSLPTDEQVLLTLSRDVDLQFELYSSLKKKLQEVEIQQVALQSHVQISERAGLPGPIARTNFFVKLLFALLVGIFLGASTAFLFEAVDPTIKHPADLERMELISLGSIPRVEGNAMRKTLGTHSYRPDLLICKEKPESVESMAFKHIRAQLVNQKNQEGEHAKVLVITSPERGDGKSFMASNIAVSLSQLEKKTLLIDCDMRNPSIPWLFGYKEADGLSSVLTLKAALNDILIKERIPHLDILPAGWSPPNPSELISNDKFRILLNHLKAQYDYIIIDSPPAVSVVDASVLAGFADSVLLVAGFRKTKKNLMLLAVRKILQVSHKQIYTILNNVWEVHEYTTYNYFMPEENSGRVYTMPDAQSELEKFQESLKKKKAG